jgi:alpha-mannosidase
MGEDVPAAWDNWDIDRDQRHKLQPAGRLVRREVVADGPLQLRIRFEYELGRESRLVQDVVFHSTTPRVDFDTHVDWHERYQFLKVGFTLDILADTARHEIQFGHVVRNAHDNTSQDRAQFDVCAHKWTDISETGYGVAFLNDCKYACTIKDGEYRLSLIKSGRRPDPRGDEGVHRFAYAAGLRVQCRADGFAGFGFLLLAGSGRCAERYRRGGEVGGGRGRGDPSALRSFEDGDARAGAVWVPGGFGGGDEPS